MRNERNDKIYTPLHIAKIMATELLSDGYNGKILDLCCGSGNLTTVLAQYINDKYAIPFSIIFDKHLSGLDLDGAAIAAAKDRFSTEFPGLKKKNINYFTSDFFSFVNNRQNHNQYDFIICNPPYIRFQDLSDEERDALRDAPWYSGNMDISLYYFMRAFDLLRPGGRLCFIMPTSFIYGSSAQQLVENLNTYPKIEKFLDFRDIKVFHNVGAYVGIFVGSKRPPTTLKYIDMISNECKVDLYLPNNGPFGISRPNSLTSGTRLSDICCIRTGIATLCDNVYFVDNDMSDVEKDCLLPCYKSKGRTQIIYPYLQKGSQIGRPLTEEEITDQFPKLKRYMLKHKDGLLRRDKGKIDPKNWFLFGRTQGISSLFGEKVFLPTLYKPGIEQAITEEGSLISGGYGLFPRKDINVEYIMSILKTERFIQSIRSSCKPMPGGFFQISKRALENIII